MDHSSLLALLVAFPAVGIINAVLHGLDLRHFLAQVPRIERRAHLVRYKEVVKRQMFAALSQIVLLAAPTLLFFYGWTAKLLVPSDLLYVIVPSLVVIAVGLYFKSVENRARALEVPDEALRAERDEVNEVWIRKPFPNW